MYEIFEVGDRVKFNKLGHLDQAEPNWVYGTVDDIHHPDHVMSNYHIQWDDGFDDDQYWSTAYLLRAEEGK